MLTGVDVEALAAVALVLAISVFVYTAFARRLDHWHLTAPIVFVVAGWLIWSTQDRPDGQLSGLLALAEVTLALVLFTDAAGVRPAEIGRDRGPIIRLLFIGLPLTVILGTGLAMLVFGAFAWPVALLLGAMLAPTDAALGAATVTDRRLPRRIRRLLNVESGLNDGFATPVVLFAIAVVAGQEGLIRPVTAAQAMREIAVGIAFGVLVGYVGGWLLEKARTRDWTTARSAAIAALAVPAVSYFGTLLVGGNGFLAAFMAGTAFAAASRPRHTRAELELAEEVVEPLSFATWMAFGALAVPVMLVGVGWQEVVFAIASLTVLRMVPVALSLLGTGFRPRTLLFIGWFGPRGLATVVFTLIALESLEPTPILEDVLATATLTVLLSVLLHGVSASPGAARYAAWIARRRPAAETAAATVPRVRGAMARARGFENNNDTQGNDTQGNGTPRNDNPRNGTPRNDNPRNGTQGNGNPRNDNPRNSTQGNGNQGTSPPREE